MPLDVPPGESGPQDLAEEPDEAEKIEVHVHLHRADAPKGSRARHPPRPVSTGKLFDWQWYEHRIRGKRQPAPGKRWRLAAKCQSCQAPLSSTALRCPHCAAPQSRRLRLALLALVGLGSVIAVFFLCAHVLGGSATEPQALRPLGQWSDDDFVIVEVPSGTPSPFGYNQPAASGSAAPPGAAGAH